MLIIRFPTIAVFPNTVITKLLSAINYFTHNNYVNASGGKNTAAESKQKQLQFREQPRGYFD